MHGGVGEQGWERCAGCSGAQGALQAAARLRRAGIVPAATPVLASHPAAACLKQAYPPLLPRRLAARPRLRWGRRRTASPTRSTPPRFAPVGKGPARNGAPLERGVLGSVADGVVTLPFGFVGRQGGGHLRAARAARRRVRLRRREPSSRPPRCSRVQAAVEEGIVPGGGTALVYASRSLEAVKEKCENFDQKVSGPR